MIFCVFVQFQKRKLYYFFKLQNIRKYWGLAYLISGKLNFFYTKDEQ